MSESTSLHPHRSMTGQGHARSEGEPGAVSVEIRTVNNRGFKCILRVSDPIASLESRIEALARTLIHRGTVHLAVRWEPAASQDGSLIDTQLLAGYCRQLRQVQQQIDDIPTSIDLASLMTLPGVINASRERLPDSNALWQVIQEGVVRAIENLNQMREAEGAHMVESLTRECAEIRKRLTRIGGRAPLVIDHYRKRLETKVRRILAENRIETQPIDLLREVQIFADRSDVSEEITRLDSHLNLFVAVLAGQTGDSGHREPSGRKLDFVTQEMFRETNTIGSKASDAEVSAEVVEIKCAIERMRELVQNLE